MMAASSELEPPIKKHRKRKINLEETVLKYPIKAYKSTYETRLDSIPKQMYHREIGLYSNRKNTFNPDRIVFRQSWSWYEHIKCVKKCFTRPKHALQGAVFNIEFSPDSKYLVAACESLDIVLYDPCIQKKICRVAKAHQDSVNCVTFLDTRTFATCSDDKTIALWDIRKLQNKIVTLKGHTSWVKSMSYNKSTKQLVSSAFDDTVRTWDINSTYKDGVVPSKKVLSIPYLTRTRLSPDFTQMIVATTTGHLFVIHDLNIDTVATDTAKSLNKIILNQDKSMQVETSIKQNRVEFISDFPSNDKPWCIASLQIHPYGKNILSRYTSENSLSEWTVVHNIQPYTGYKPTRRLCSYIEEPNLASGYIKELCYNHDGTVICSPFGNSIRILSFSPSYDNFTVPEHNKELIELKSLTSHKKSVLTTRFSPTLPLIASGCLGGQVSFYHPKF